MNLSSEPRPVQGVEGGGVGQAGGEGGRQPRQRGGREGGQGGEGGREWGGSGSLVRRISVGLQWEVAGQQLAGRPSHQPGVAGGVRGGEVGVSLQVDQQLLRAAVPLPTVIPAVHPVTDVGTSGAQWGGGWQGGGGHGRRGREAGQLVSLQQLQVAGRQPQSGHVGVVHSNGTARVLAVRVTAHRPRPAVRSHGGVSGQTRDGARHPEREECQCQWGDNTRARLTWRRGWGPWLRRAGEAWRCPAEGLWGVRPESPARCSLWGWCWPPRCWSCKMSVWRGQNVTRLGLTLMLSGAVSETQTLFHCWYLSAGFLWEIWKQTSKKCLLTAVYVLCLPCINVRWDRFATSILTPSLTLHSLEQHKLESLSMRLCPRHLSFNIFGCFIRFERHRLTITDHYGGAAAFTTEMGDILSILCCLFFISSIYYLLFHFFTILFFLLTCYCSYCYWTASVSQGVLDLRIKRRYKIKIFKLKIDYYLDQRLFDCKFVPASAAEICLTFHPSEMLEVISTATPAFYLILQKYWASWQLSQGSTILRILIGRYRNIGIFEVLWEKYLL